MRLRESFVVRASGNQELEFELPLALELDDGSQAQLSEADEESVLLVIDRPIDPLELTLETKSGHFEATPGGGKCEVPTIRVPGGGNIRAIDVSAALTFLTDIPLTVNRVFGGELVAEGEEDHAALEALGTRLVHSETTVLLNTRTFSGAVDSDAIRALIPKTAGLRLYADAMTLPTDVSKYRELWRCLESAFARKGNSLISALSSYRPAQELGFDEAELRELHTLRGRVSHAESRAGLKEMLQVGDEASKKAPRLKCLVERVILTKRDWGVRTTEVDELAPAVSWISRDGAVVWRPLATGGAEGGSDEGTGT